MRVIVPLTKEMFSPDHFFCSRVAFYRGTEGWAPPVEVRERGRAKGGGGSSWEGTRGWGGRGIQG